jgi:hypothetical protein
MDPVKGFPELGIIAAQLGIDAGEVDMDGAVYKVAAFNDVRDTIHGYRAADTDCGFFGIGVEGATTLGTSTSADDAEGIGHLVADEGYVVIC